MISTYTSYQLVTRDIDRSIKQVAQQPMVKRETEYYLENISKVGSVEEFVNNTRLFNYAMKAHGLEDMAYAKAFMVKVLKEGISDPNSFANKLTDKRYFEFAKTFNFDAHGQSATVYNPAQQGTVLRYQLEATLAGVDPLDRQLAEQSEYYLDNIAKVTSIDQFLADDKLFGYAMRAFGLADRLGDKDFMRQVLAGGVENPDSLANRQADKRYADFAAAFDFARLGENATTASLAQDAVAQKFMRQTLEENAGLQNEGVRLALYFQRKAADIKSAFDILGDPALGTVVRTALNIPDAAARGDIDRQAQMITNRIDLADFQDPEKVEKFLTRFTAMWEIGNSGAVARSPAAILIGQPMEMGISVDALLTLARLGR